MGTIIEYRDFSWRYDGCDEWALKGIDLSLNERECVGIVGANEQGKTTLVRCLNGLIPFGYRGIMKGEVTVRGIDIKHGSQDELSKITGMVFSDPESQFTSMSVEEELLFGLENLGLSHGEIGSRLEWIREEFSLSSIYQKPPYQLSGGQKQRVAIASVVVMKPDILVLDEPASMLDPEGREEIFRILKRLRNETGMTLLIVEHDLGRLVEIAERILFVRDGALFYSRDTRDFIDSFDYGDESLYLPEVSQLFSRLRNGGRLQADFPIPYLLEEGIKKYGELFR